MDHFTKETTSLVDINHVCAAVAKTVSETFAIQRVSIWLIDENLNGPSIIASTVFSPSETEEIEALATPLVELARNQRAPIDLRGREDGTIEGISTEFLDKAGIRFCAPLVAGGEFIGMLTLGGRAGQPFSIEDLQLMETFADQAAGLILNYKLFDSLGRARETEAFQAVSAFFAHDLKNVASTLSLTLTNLPVHYDNPEFRADALKMMTKSVEKIQNMQPTVGPQPEIRIITDVNAI